MPMPPTQLAVPSEVAIALPTGVILQVEGPLGLVWPMQCTRTNGSDLLASTIFKQLINVYLDFFLLQASTRRGTQPSIVLPAWS